MQKPGESPHTFALTCSVAFAVPGYLAVVHFTQKTICLHCPVSQADAAPAGTGRVVPVAGRQDWTRSQACAGPSPLTSVAYSCDLRVRADRCCHQQNKRNWKTRRKLVNMATTVSQSSSTLPLSPFQASETLADV